MDSERIVYLVAGDAQARRGLTARVKRLALPLVVCHSADQFLALAPPAVAGCILLDVSQPAVDLELLGRLGPAEARLPLVAIAAAADVATAVATMKLGAADFLEASCTDRQLAEAIAEAFRSQAVHRRRIALVTRVRRRMARLTPGCREVLALLLAGKRNREIAVELELSVRAIEVRRANVMRTMRARSLSELVRLVVAADGLPSATRE